MAPKKGRRSRLADSDSDNEPSSIKLSETEENNLVKTKPAKKTSKKKAQKTKKLGDWSDEDVDDPLKDATAEDDEIYAPKNRGFSNISLLQSENVDSDTLESPIKSSGKKGFSNISLLDIEEDVHIDLQSDGKEVKEGEDLNEMLTELGINDVKQSTGEKKKKKKKKGDLSLEAIADDDADVIDVGTDALSQSTNELKKANGGKEENLDALLAEFGVNVSSEGSDLKKKKKKKGELKIDADNSPKFEPELPINAKDSKKGKEAEEEDLDALLAQFGVDTSQSAETDKKKKKKKKKGASDEIVADDCNGEDLVEPSREALSEGADAADAVAEEEPKELTAAQKKKLKKKAKDKAKKEEGAGGKAPPAKKESAAVRKLREDIERMKAVQEAAQAEEEERIRKEEEAELNAAAEAKRKEEEKQRRKEEKNKHRAELKRQGLLLSAKQKQEADRLAAMRDQILKNSGVEIPVVSKKPVYGKKKNIKSQKRSTSDLVKDDEVEENTETTLNAGNNTAVDSGIKPEEKARSDVNSDEKSESSDEDVGWEDLDDDKILLKPQKEDTEASEDCANVSLEKAKRSDEDASKQPRLDEDSTNSSDDTDSTYDSSDESIDSEEAREERIKLARDARNQRLAEARKAGNTEDLRSPICCILGHVDTGKTKLLDNIRRTSVQEGEAGGITQQIGATYVPGSAIEMRTRPIVKDKAFDLKLPGLLIIDTPGHESFTNLRSRGSSLCDIAILVVDIMHGLEPQTIESISLLKQKKTPFIVALNKVDRLFEWESFKDSGIQDSLSKQKDHVKIEFEDRLKKAILNLNEQGLNVALYWKNSDPRKFVNIVPTSAITGEGLPDMLQLVVQLTQKMMAERLMFISELQCTVLEVKVIEGLGTTIDVVLVNGVLHEGDQIVLCGLHGPIVTTIRSLLTPHPLKELRVRGSYLHHKSIKAAQGIKIAAPNLESAVAGTQMFVVRKGDNVEDLKDEVMGDMVDIFQSVDKSGEGVCVQASTLGSLEALLEFLRSDAVKIPVSGINIGPVHKKDVMRASTMIEKGHKKYSVILAFDVPVTKEAQEQANNSGVKIFTADIIYHLFDQFSAYLKIMKEEEQQAASAEAVFPVILKIMPTCIFNAKDPIILGCTVEEGVARVGAPLCVPSKGNIMLGKIASMELNHKAVNVARKGDSIALKIEASNTEESARLYGRHFDHQDALVSKISRRSIDLLKLHFKDEMERQDWILILKLKKVFNLD